MKKLRSEKLRADFPFTQNDPPSEVQQDDLSKRQEFGSALLAEPHGAVMFSCRTLTFSAKVSCRTSEIAEPEALNLEKYNLAEPWNAGCFRVCPFGGAKKCASQV